MMTPKEALDQLSSMIDILMERMTNYELERMEEIERTFEKLINEKENEK